MKRTLILKSEFLAELTVDELGAVVGADDTRVSGNTCPVVQCVIDKVNSRYIPCTV